MEQYISKSSLVAEIKKRRDRNQEICTAEGSGAYYEDGFILDIINSLEVKEVDLEKEIDNIWNPRFNLGWDEKSLLSTNYEGFTTIAKYFFKLGMVACNKAQKGE